jgi:hypothetical protein
MQLIKGFFYECQRQRIVSRAGQPLQTRTGIEIGKLISRESALREVRGGRDVYTPYPEDAYRLALQVNGRKPIEHIPHHPPQSSPTGRMDVYFRHYHPGKERNTKTDDEEDKYGHIFFGERGEDYISRRVPA